jgi:hypothetical protein
MGVRTTIIENTFFQLNKYQVCWHKNMAKGSSDLQEKVVLTPGRQKKVALTPGNRVFHRENGSSDLHIR